MQVRDIMTADVETLTPDLTIQTAARMMDDLNVGVLPVCDGTRLVGVVTDRDITVRATSAGRPPDRCTIREVMTDEVRYCFEDSAVEDAARQMQELQIRRLPVVRRDDKALVGIVSLGDIATDVERDKTVADTLKEISEPSRPDRR